MNMDIINCTPHAINLMLGTNNSITFPPSGIVVRCTTQKECVGTLDVSESESVQILRTAFGEVTGLPEPKENTVFIVSALVAQAMKGVRNDLIIVDNTVRDDKGQIIGCTSFGII